MVIFHSFEGYQTVFSPLEELVKSGRLHDTRSRLPGDPNVELKMVFVTYTYIIYISYIQRWEDLTSANLHYENCGFSSGREAWKPVQLKRRWRQSRRKCPCHPAVHCHCRDCLRVGLGLGTAVKPHESPEGFVKFLPIQSNTHTHICSMYGMFTYIWAIFGVNVVRYSIHWAFGMSIHELVCEQAVLRLVLSSNLDTASNGWSQDWFDIDIATGVEHRRTPRFRAFGSFGSEFLRHFPAVLEMTTWDDLAFENWFQSSTPLVNESYHGMSLAFSGQGQSKRPSWHFRQKVRLCPRRAGASGCPGFHPVLISSPNSARLLRAVFHLL